MSALSRPLRWYWRDNDELFLADTRRVAARELDLRASWRGCRCCGFVFFRFTDFAVATRLALGHGSILWRPDECRRCLSLGIWVAVYLEANLLKWEECPALKYRPHAGFSVDAEI